MIWTRQAPFPPHTYRAVLQLSHALGVNKLRLALSFGWRAVLSLACSSRRQRLGQQLPAGTRAAPQRGGREWQQQEVLWAADPVWAGTESHRFGSAGTKWGQTAPAEMMAPLVVQGNCSRLGLKGSELLPACVCALLSEVTSERADLCCRGSGPGTFPSCGSVALHSSSCSYSQSMLWYSCPTPMAPSMSWIAKRVNRPKSSH